jgi:hypothetical protein
MENNRLKSTNRALTIISILLIAFTSSCISPKKALDRGDYDMAIDIAVKKLKKDPTKQKHIDVLNRAYGLANSFNNERITFLKRSGEPDIWTEVFDTYNLMKIRQDKVRVLNQNILTKINYRYVNYDKEIISSKKKAAEYYYAHGISLLEEGTKYSAREAYSDFLMVKNFYPDYKDVNQLTDEAYYSGINFVLMEIRNKSNSVMPRDFESELKKINVNDIDSKWVKYHQSADDNIDYDYYILLNLTSFYVSPGELLTNEYKDEKEVQDGWQYVLDEDGNVMQDSTGQDLKVPKYVKLAAYVTEYKMNKKSVVEGTIDYVDAHTNRLIKSDHLGAESVFFHHYADVKGERAAMSNKTKKLARTNPAPFPDDLEMIFRTTSDLKSKALSILRRNKRILEK